MQLAEPDHATYSLEFLEETLLFCPNGLETYFEQRCNKKWSEKHFNGKDRVSRQLKRDRTEQKAERVDYS